MNTLKTVLISIAVLFLGAAPILAGTDNMVKSGAKGAVKTETATFAGGCFWCMEHPFDELPGVVSVTAGYTGGRKTNPTYAEVSAGGTGHAESVQILYDPARITYTKLLDVYWRNIDPTVKARQFCDTGHQYRSAAKSRHGYAGS